MTDANKTALAIITDRSGSMHAIRTDAEGAINAFLEKQKQEPGECSVTLTQFDTVYEVVWSNKNIQDVPKYTLEPRGATALLDAIGRTITNLGNELAQLPEGDRPGKVIVVIVTDGEENASQEFNLKQVHNMITHQQENYNWEFIFLAANQDAIKTGASFGISAQSSISFAPTAQGVTNVTRSLGNYVSATRSGVGYAFTDEERAEALDGSD